MSDAAPAGARCGAHPGAPGLAVCERCGTFMCSGCCFDGVERRCPACSPRRGKAEREERRRNALRRSAVVRCLACDYVGPRLDEPPPLPQWVWAVVPATLAVPMLQPWVRVLAISVGIPATAFGLLWLLAQVEHPCASCGSALELQPGLPGVEPSDAGRATWAAADARARAVNRRNRWQIQAILALVAGGAWLGWRLLG